MSSIDYALFLDNDWHHIQQIAGIGGVEYAQVINSSVVLPTGRSGTLDYIKVPGEDKCKLKPMTPARSDFVSFTINTNQIFVEKLALLFEGKDKYDTSSGITQGIANMIKTWVSEKKEKGTTAVLFDFDRTLTQVEGFLSPENIYDFQVKYNFPELTYENIMEYLCGGNKNILMLQEMFDFLYENGVKVYIITNNRACTDNKAFMEQLVKVLTGGRPFVLLCSHPLGSRKNLAIRSNSNLVSVIPPPSFGEGSSFSIPSLGFGSPPVQPPPSQPPLSSLFTRKNKRRRGNTGNNANNGKNGNKRSKTNSSPQTGEEKLYSGGKTRRARKNRNSRRR